MPFVDRRRRGPGRFLQWKMRLLAVGAVLLLVGMAREMDLLVIVAVAILLVAFALRFFEREAPGGVEAEEGDGDEEEWPADRREPAAGEERRPPG
jgi:membrane protein implicated in regulation of membrane protease activity